MVEITKHHTVEVFIVFEDKVLLIKHKKSGLWLPPGGHIERDEILTETALKEVKEETGLDVELYNEGELINNPPRVKGLVCPVAVLLENINEFHQHVDFIYFAKSDSDVVTPEDGESNEFKWFSITNLKEGNIPKDVLELSIQAINKLCGE